MRFRKLGISIITFFTIAAAVVGQAPLPQPYAFLTRHLGFSQGDLAALETGQILVKLPKTPEVREVAAFAITRLDVPTDFFVERVRDIVNFKKGENVLQIGKFGNPPSLSDLAGLTVDQVDIDAIKECRVKSCDLKMSSEFIERFRKEVDWSSDNHRDVATQLVRKMLLEQVQDYLRRGNTALVKYDDKSSALLLADEVRSLLKPAPYMYKYAPDFQRYLEEFPLTRPGNAANFEDFIYWSKEDFGLKPVISMTHITIYRGAHGSSDVLVGSKGIYASHYFEGSLGLTAFTRSENSYPPRSYLIYINRSRTDALHGLFAGVKRSLIVGRIRTGANKNMERLKQKLEFESRKIGLNHPAEQ
jgi:hypothetical protein